MLNERLQKQEQDFVDLCQKWKTGLSRRRQQHAIDQADITAMLAGIDAFLTARTDYEEDDSSRNRLAKDEAREAAKALMQDFSNTSI
jgi:hypothetical protein